MDRADIDAWNEFAPFYQAALGTYTDVVRYGFDIGTEDDFHLLGEVKGKRVLDLGCGGGQNVVTLAKAGATAIGIDASPEQLRFAKKLAEQEEVKVELREADVSDLAYMPADNIDIALSVLTFDCVEDLARLFRGVHRILNNNGIFVFSMRHPVNSLINHGSDANPFQIERSYWMNKAIREPERGGTVLTSYQHTFSDIYSGLTRSGFRVESIIEPEPIANGARSIEWRESYTRIPPTIIVRARNEGS